MSEDLDIIIGLNLRRQRQIAGLTQTEMGDQLGVTFQQVQKYETGKNRIAASRLWTLAALLNVDINQFFEGASAPDALPEKVDQLGILVQRLLKASPEVRAAIMKLTA